jgi:hypothetical protein
VQLDAQSRNSDAAKRTEARADDDLAAALLERLGAHALPVDDAGRVDMRAEAVAALMESHAHALGLCDADGGNAPAALARLSAPAARDDLEADLLVAPDERARNAVREKLAALDASIAAEKKRWLAGALRRAGFQERLRGDEARRRERASADGSPSPAVRRAAAEERAKRDAELRAVHAAAAEAAKVPVGAVTAAPPVRIERVWRAEGGRPVAVWQAEGRFESFLQRQWSALPAEHPLRGGNAAALRHNSPSKQWMGAVKRVPPAQPPPPPPRARDAAAAAAAPPPPVVVSEALLDEFEGDAEAAALAAQMRARVAALHVPFTAAAEEPAA